MKAIDWTPIQKKYPGMWVAVLDDQETVVGSGKTVNEALERAHRSGHKDPIIMKLPTEVMPYIGGLWS